MAEQRVQDVVNQIQSVGDISPSDASATTPSTNLIVPGEVNGVDGSSPKENGIHVSSLVKMEDFDDASARSDTDTSRAEGSVAGDKTSDAKPLKKFTPKPVSFAKYSVPKVIAANAASKGSDKVVPTNSPTSSLLQAGRPRLVAKSASNIQQKSQVYKSAAPDPMQVWNKNRVTPQPSTKHLTDEELKQQYGIHLTSRLQSDGDGKEAKWADIDDDEDDWAPETIEWNDGTKSTLNAAEASPAVKSKNDLVDTDQSTSTQSKPIAPQFISSVGPNATVLKLGASAERQQAQKAVLQQSRMSIDRSTIPGNKTSPAPAPAKSPWAQLPPVDRVSPIAINPTLVTSMLGPRPITQGSTQSPIAVRANSPTKEISADDFNRSWRDSTSGQPKELYMPNSGRYEAVSEGRRRMSKNDQNFRASTVLQRPTQGDVHAPAEPSPAFQTSRTSMDGARRRASSTLSGSSGQFARRMSIRSGETAPVFDSQFSAKESTRSESHEAQSPLLANPTYQAQGPNAEILPNSNSQVSQHDLEAQRLQQKALMRENIERARRRKVEEEERLEAEKRERIRLKLASLGPDPKIVKPQAEEVTSQETNTAVPITSPPKPPQPLASGEPQQYGMMKVHPLDSVQKLSGPMTQTIDANRSTAMRKSSNMESLKAGISVPNGMRSMPDIQRSTLPESVAPPEPSPKLSKPASMGSEMRGGWPDGRHEHRSPQTGNLWGLPNNKALGNGTFDQSLAGYAPQDLSRTSSTAQGWMNRPSTSHTRSPQQQHANLHSSEGRNYVPPPSTSPDQTPLALDSEVDSLFPTTRPAPIAPPQSQTAINGSSNSPQLNGNLTAWNNFHQVASPQERAEIDKIQRELQAKREEELRTGVRQGPSYTFNETWKQVHLGDQAGQRQVSGTSQSSVNSNMFGAVRSGPAVDASTRMANGPNSRGSRFFPHVANGHHPQDRRNFTYSHPEVSRTPSPPPAEEISSAHPAFDGDFHRPVVHFPREKAVVKLPPSMSPAPPAASPPLQPEDDDSTAPLTWAARLSKPAPTTTPPLRAVSTPIVQHPSWQERFNGLLGRKSSPTKQSALPVTPALAVASSSREPLDALSITASASVSLPESVYQESLDEELAVATTKDVEDEEDLFEDRELASLPTIHLPAEMPMLLSSRSSAPRIAAIPIDPTSAAGFMVNNLFERHFTKPQFAIIRLPFNNNKSVKRDIPTKNAPPVNSFNRNRKPSAPYAGKNPRVKSGVKSRQVSKVH